MKVEKENLSDQTGRESTEAGAAAVEDGGGGGGAWRGSSWRGEFANIRWRSMDSSSSSMSDVLRLMQEHRSKEVKKAETTLDPTKFATVYSRPCGVMALLFSSIDADWREKMRRRDLDDEKTEDIRDLRERERERGNDCLSR